MRDGLLKSNSIEGIQYLRGIAALLVVLFHIDLAVIKTNFGMSVGYVGVDIFFIISGFVMAHTTRNLKLSNTKERITEFALFLKKRFIRVIPLYWIATIFTYRRELIHGEIQSELFKDLMFVPHFNLEYTSLIQPKLAQGWTLNYEMFFYALFALSILFGQYRLRLVALFFACLVIAGKALDFYGYSPELDSFKYVLVNFYTNDILLEFVLGIVAQKTISKWSWSFGSKSINLILLVTAFMMLFIGAHFYSGAMRFLLLGVPAYFIVIFAIKSFEGTEIRVLKILGDASYAIYLFHFTSFGLLKPMAPWFNQFSTSYLGTLLVILSYAAISVASGVAIHLFLEKPLTRIFGNSTNATRVRVFE